MGIIDPTKARRIVVYLDPVQFPLGDAEAAGFISQQLNNGLERKPHAQPCVVEFVGDDGKVMQFKDGVGFQEFTMTPFFQVLMWLQRERWHQQRKFDYGPLDEAHALEGLGDGSWFWDHGVLNYANKARLFGVTGDTAQLGVQAILKLAATMIAMVEHLVRGGHAELPRPGLTSGNLE